MTRVVNLPPGCSSLQMQDGTQYRAGRPGGQVTVADGHGDAINRMGGNGTAGLVNGNPGQFFHSRATGRRCVPCNRRYFMWTTNCHKCGGPTEPE
jgi:hypothetical protein